MGRVLTQEQAVLASEEREFELTDKDFKFIQWFIHKHVGIYLTDKKRAMVYGRLSRKMREKGLKRFCEYREYIEGSPEEKMGFINALTTNKTQFFREQHHMEFVENKLAPYWLESAKSEVRIWSAGCSTGEEPYSYLASLNYIGVLDAVASVKVLATDLDTNVLAKAREGVYSDECIDSIPERYRKGCFLKGKDDHQGLVKVSEQLKSHVRFNQLNLLGDWPMKKQFDVISCRNVMIYFDRPTQLKLIERFYSQLADDGVLFIGHSESVGTECSLFKHLGKTIYVKA